MDQRHVPHAVEIDLWSIAKRPVGVWVLDCDSSPRSCRTCGDSQQCATSAAQSSRIVQPELNFHIDKKSMSEIELPDTVVVRCMTMSAVFNASMEKQADRYGR